MSNNTNEKVLLASLEGVVIVLEVTSGHTSLSTSFHGSVSGRVRVMRGRGAAVWVGDFCFNLEKTMVSMKDGGDYRLYVEACQPVDPLAA